MRSHRSGQFPAKVLTSYSPLDYGRADHLFCLWEADRPEDITAVLEQSGLSAYLTSDIMQVDELDWIQLGVQEGVV